MISYINQKNSIGGKDTKKEGMAKMHLIKNKATRKDMAALRFEFWGNNYELCINNYALSILRVHHPVRENIDILPKRNR